MSAAFAIPVRVSGIEAVAARIKRIRLECPDGRPLWLFSPGAHVVVSMNDGGRLHGNPCSLMSEPEYRGADVISVLRAERSRSGSAFIRDALKDGDELTISHPVNLVPADKRGRKHILIAGGIGITPFIAMMTRYRDTTIKSLSRHDDGAPTSPGIWPDRCGMVGRRRSFLHGHLACPMMAGGHGNGFDNKIRARQSA